MPFEAGEYVALPIPSPPQKRLADIESSLNDIAGFPLSVSTGFVSLGTAEGTGYWKFFKDYTNGADGGTVVNISAFHDGNIGGVGTQGSVASFYSGVGYNQTATGNSHTLATVMEVRNCANPSGAFMEVAAEFSYVGCQWLDALGGSTPTTYTNSGIGLWGRDYSVVGSPFGQDAYISSITNYVAKYSATSTIDGFHMGSNGIAVVTLPNSGPGFGSRAGQTAYAIDDGFVVTGFAGAVDDNPTDGNHADATEGFTYAFRAGGPNGAAWTHQKAYSKIGTGFICSDYTTYGFHAYRRHPNAAGGALYIQDGAGSVGIWQTPVNADAYPLVVGKSYAGNQNIRIDNGSASASATARIEFNTDAGSGALQQVSTAAGNNTTLYGPGDMFVGSTASGKIIGFFTNNARVVTIDGNGNLKIGGTAARGTTESTGALALFNGTAPVGTLTNGVTLYSASGECRVMDSAGNSTLLSPHDRDTNEWIYHSVDTRTGKGLRIDMERMMRAINEKFGWDFIREFEV